MFESLPKGLSSKEAAARLKREGPNKIATKKRQPWWHLVVVQFTSPLILILIAAALLKTVLAEWLDVIVITVTVVVNALLGFWQEIKAEKSLDALQSVLSPVAVVLREGKREEVSADTLVTGDVVLLDEGTKMPADGVLIMSEDLAVNEALLTGESVPVRKRSLEASALKELDAAAKHFYPVDKRKDNEGRESVYSGSTVVAGSGVLLVVQTGMHTEMGKIAHTLSEAVERPTPLQERLKRLSRMLAVMVVVIAVLVVLVGLVVGQSVEELMGVAVALAVAAIPEGLVISLTVILSVGMQRILRRKALVRKLMAAEVLGSVSVICSDKTGTLTEGNLKVEQAHFVDERLGFASMLMATEMKDPLEVALYEWARGQVSASRQARIHHLFSRIDRWGFDASRRMSVTLTSGGLFAVGAPEVVIAGSRISAASRGVWEKELDTWSNQGLRVVAVGHRRALGEKKLTKQVVAKRWQFLGLIAFADPVRTGVAKALKQAKGAGMQLKVVTGDYPQTAAFVLHKLGMTVSDGEIMEGHELEEVSEEELDRRIGNIILFARTTPSQKLKIVESLQRIGVVVAMTGDGVNDAPALRQADIGVVVSSASDVSKETADMVLLNDDFSTIVAAVEEGRGIFHNLQKIILYLLSDAFAEIIVVVGSLLLRLPLPITAAQILWVNLVNDGFPNLALTLEPKPRGLLTHPPIRPSAPLIDRYMKVVIATVSGLTGLGVLASFWWLIELGRPLIEARTFSFSFLALSTLTYVFSTRALHRPIWQSRVFKNPWLIVAVLFGFVMQILAVYFKPFQLALETMPLTIGEWVAMMMMALGLVVIIEAIKWAFFTHVVHRVPMMSKSTERI